MSNYIDGADKLLGVRQLSKEFEEVTNKKIVEWNGICPYCNSHKLNIHPIDIVYRPHTVYEFGDLDIEQQRYYKNLPTIIEAIELALDRNHQLLIECFSCHTITNGFLNEKPGFCNEQSIKVKPNKAKLLRYISQLHSIDEAQELFHRIKR